MNFFLKKIILPITLIFIISTAFFFYLLQPKNNKNDKCVFCERKILDYQKYYEDDLVIALFNYRPLTDGHCLVIPKRHISSFNDISDEEIIRVRQIIIKTDMAVRKIKNTKSYILLQKNGKEVGQTVDHVHFHYIPRKESEKYVFNFLLKFLTYPLKRPMSKIEMENIRNQLKKEFKNVCKTS